MSDFQARFGSAAILQSEAPGRVNLMGEHTDYNSGFVLPTVLPQRTIIRMTRTEGPFVRAASTSVAGDPLVYRLGEERPGQGWLDYVQGTTSLLRAEGQTLGGFDVLLDSDVPIGSGLSSSAALLVALTRTLRAAFGLRLEDQALALFCQRVENQFVGAQVGVMDPMACSLGEVGKALFLDTQTLAHEHIPLPREADWAVIHSGVAHQHSAGDYNKRRAECEQACALLGVRQLRDLGPTDLSRLTTLPDPLARRARHVITENARVLNMVEALRDRDLARIGVLFHASHDSQRDDYEVSVPAIDQLVALARKHEDVYGARLTGGGFGGSIVLVARRGRGLLAARQIAQDYAAATGHRPMPLPFGALD